MGWCSATTIFDALVGELVNHHAGNTDEAQMMDMVVPLARVLLEGDWDCVEDSAYIDVPWVREALIRAGVELHMPCPTCGHMD